VEKERARGRERPGALRLEMLRERALRELELLGHLVWDLVLTVGVWAVRELTSAKRLYEQFQ